MRESFGSDGQPGSYADIDVTDCIFLVGHNMSATQTVLWSRILDRLAGENPPKIVVMDPRRTECAKKADVHIASRVGTNLAVLNGIQRLLFENDWIDHDYVEQHTIGVDKLRETVQEYTPEKVEEISGVPASVLKEAAKTIGTAKSLLSTALQGVYQSNQATASACAVNNINLLLGKVGKPGSGILQMNGQPTAQNNREVKLHFEITIKFQTGCDGEYPGFRNPKNIEHMRELAEYWNIDLNHLPHWGQPTHIMEMLSFISGGTMRMFWISGTNPAVSMPNLNRIRKLLSMDSLFVVVQDIFLTETAMLADLVLPAAMWGEKTGCFTNVDRTVHIAHKAVDPPGECRSDLDIFVDFAKRMGFKDKDGNDLIPFRTTHEAFEAHKHTTRGRPCDYTGLSYEKLTGGSGIQWPCNEDHPNGTERLFADGKFFTGLNECESYGHDLELGIPLSRAEYALMNPNGRAILKSCKYRPAEEATSAEYPFTLSTGRNVYQFHTRTKTGRTEKLQEAEPRAWIQISKGDAARLDIHEGELVVVSSPHGSVQVPARIGDIKEGQTFIPFHYGYFDQMGSGLRGAANELTMTSWDFVSKQPIFKTGAVKIEKAPDVKLREPQSAAVKGCERTKPGGSDSSQQPKCHLLGFLSLFLSGNDVLREIYESLAQRHDGRAEIRQAVKILLELCLANHDTLKPFAEDYHANLHTDHSNMGIFRDSLFPSARSIDLFGLLMDMHGLATYLQQQEAILTSLSLAATARHDAEFKAAVTKATDSVDRQKRWAQNQISVRSPQALLVPKP